jgi:hypothetical protein
MYSDNKLYLSKLLPWYTQWRYRSEDKYLTSSFNFILTYILSISMANIYFLQIFISPYLIRLIPYRKTEETFTFYKLCTISPYFVLIFYKFSTIYLYTLPLIRFEINFLTRLSAYVFMFSAPNHKLYTWKRNCHTLNSFVFSTFTSVSLCSFKIGALWKWQW